MGVSAAFSPRAPCDADESRSEPCADTNTPMASHWTFGRKYTQTRCSSRSQTRSLQKLSFRYARRQCYLGSVLTRDEIQDFASDAERARRWRALRQDSGDPFAFAPRAKEVYERLGINYRESTIIYSDSLDLDKTLALKKHCEEIGFIGLSSLTPFLSVFGSLNYGLHAQRLLVSARSSQTTSSRYRARARTKAERST